MKNITQPWRSVLQAARVKGLTIHDLRRSFATAARSDGMSREDVGDLLGHAAMDVTGVYARQEIKRRRILAEAAAQSVLRRLYPTGPRKAL